MFLEVFVKKKTANQTVFLIQLIQIIYTMKTFLKAF